MIYEKQNYESQFYIILAENPPFLIVKLLKYRAKHRRDDKAVSGQRAKTETEQQQLMDDINMMRTQNQNKNQNVRFSLIFERNFTYTLFFDYRLKI